MNSPPRYLPLLFQTVQHQQPKQQLPDHAKQSRGTRPQKAPTPSLKVGKQQAHIIQVVIAKWWVVVEAAAAAAGRAAPSESGVNTTTAE